MKAAEIRDEQPLTSLPKVISRKEWQRARNQVALYNPSRAVRMERWRCTGWLNEKQESAGVELYDHHADPVENDNIAARPAALAIVVELAKVLHAGWTAARPE